MGSKKEEYTEEDTINYFIRRRNDWNGNHCNGYPHIKTIVLMRDGWKAIFAMTNSLIIST